MYVLFCFFHLFFSSFLRFVPFAPNISGKSSVFVLFGDAIPLKLHPMEEKVRATTLTLMKNDSTEDDVTG